MKNSFIFLFITTFFLIINFNVNSLKAHSGGLNSKGCHGGKKPYHCHRAPNEMVGNKLRCDLGSKSKECQNSYKMESLPSTKPIVKSHKNVIVKDFIPSKKSFSSLASSDYEDIQKCIPFRDTVLKYEERPKNPGDVVSLAEKYCQKGSKMHIDDIPEWWTPYVIYNVCDMKYSVHVERFGTKEEPLASVICLYEGRIVYN